MVNNYSDEKITRCKNVILPVFIALSRLNNDVYQFSSGRCFALDAFFGSEM